MEHIYIYHQKSSNNFYQRKSYSGQKKRHLCKPFTVCTTTGYIVDMLGPFEGTENDASIMKRALENSSALGGFLQAGYFCFVDRGFRGAEKYMEERGLVVRMPALKGKRNQLTVEEANASRYVTKIRWVVEAVHGIIKQKFKLLLYQTDNKLLPKLFSLIRVACFLNNSFWKRLESDESDGWWSVRPHG